MVSITQVQRGLTEFVDREVLPHMQGFERVMLGMSAGLISNKLPCIMEKIADHPILSTLDIYHKGSGDVDIDAIYKAARPYVGNEAFPVKIPIIGVTLKMGQKELEDLYRYIKQG